MLEHDLDGLARLGAHGAVALPLLAWGSVAAAAGAYLLEHLPARRAHGVDVLRFVPPLPAAAPHLDAALAQAAPFQAAAAVATALLLGATLVATAQARRLHAPHPRSGTVPLLSMVTVRSSALAGRQAFFKQKFIAQARRYHAEAVEARRLRARLVRQDGD